MCIRDSKKAIPETLNERDSSIEDFYTDYDPLDTDAIDQKEYEDYIASLSPEEKALVEKDPHFYSLSFENNGIPMPLILEFKYADGTSDVKRVPAEIWRFSDTVTKTFVLSKKVVDIVLDPYLETADVDVTNNTMQPSSSPTRFDLFKRSQGPRGSSRGQNPIQRAKKAKELKKAAQQP